MVNKQENILVKYQIALLCKKKMCYTEPFKGSRFGYHFKNPLRFKQNLVLSCTSFFCCQKWFNLYFVFCYKKWFQRAKKVPFVFSADTIGTADIPFENSPDRNNPVDLNSMLKIFRFAARRITLKNSPT